MEEPYGDITKFLFDLEYATNFGLLSEKNR